MNTGDRRPLLVIFGFGAIMAAVAYALLQVVPAVSSQVAATSVYVTTVAVPVGQPLAAGDFVVSAQHLSPNIAGNYLSTSSKINFSQYEVAVGLPIGALVPLSDLVPLASSNQVGVAVSFKASPNLAPGDLVDIYVSAGGAGGGAMTLLLSNVRLQSAVSSGGFVINVPDAVSGAVLYASQNATLYATLVPPGNTGSTGPPISSLSQAIQQVASHGGGSNG